MSEELDYIEGILFEPDPALRCRRLRSENRVANLLPEVFRLDGVPQPPEHHPEGDALVHTLLAVGHLPSGYDRRLAWAALLHDIGKAGTTREVEGRVRAYGHDREGAELAQEVLERLGMDRECIDDVVWLVRHHMFALSWQVDRCSRFSRRQRRFMADPRFPLLVDLLEIDANASGPNRAKLAHARLFRRVLQGLC